MGRTNGIILAMGFGSILVLSLMMQHVMKVHEDRSQPPAVREIQTTFGARLSRESELKIVETEDGARRAELTVYPLLGVSQARLSRDVGQFLWRRAGIEEGLSHVQVVCVDLADGEKTFYPIPRPYMTRRVRLRREPGKRAPRAAQRRAAETPARPAK